MTHRAWLIALTAALAACSQKGPAPEAEPVVATVAAAGETAPTAQDGANGVAIWVHPEDGARSLVLGAGGTGGLEVYGLDGTLKQRVSDIEASQVMVRYGFEIGGARQPLVLAYDPMRSALTGYTIDDGQLCAPARRADPGRRRADGTVRLHQRDHGPRLCARHDGFRRHAPVGAIRERRRARGPPGAQRRARQGRGVLRGRRRERHHVLRRRGARRHVAARRPGNRSGTQDRRPRGAARRDHRRGQGHRTRAGRGRQGAPHRVRYLVGAFLCL